MTRNITYTIEGKLDVTRTAAAKLDYWFHEVRPYQVAYAIQVGRNFKQLIADNRLPQ